MSKLRIAVLFGGLSGEHEISCISAAAIVDNMNADEYEVYKIGITKKGRWLLYPGPTEGMRDGSWNEFPDNAPAVLSPDRTTRGLMVNHGAKLDVVKLDVIFPALHGFGGEDGTIQGLMELSGIPYVGCGVLSSAMCMDKATANKLFDMAGIPHTPWVAVHRSELEDFEALLFRVKEKISFPLCVKPAGAGSSLGVSKVDSPEDLRSAALLASTHDDVVLFEQMVVGKEVEVAVLGNQDPIATLPGEIVPCNELYDYDAKYNSGDASQLHLPARLPAETQEEVRQMALDAYKALGCEGLSRIDFFVEENNRVLINEINTLPGFTTISMYPKLMEMTRFSFPVLVDRLIQLALERAGH